MVSPTAGFVCSIAEPSRRVPCMPRRRPLVRDFG
jgi:hypothetical protein